MRHASSFYGILTNWMRELHSDFSRQPNSQVSVLSFPEESATSSPIPEGRKVCLGWAGPDWGYCTPSDCVTLHPSSVWWNDVSSEAAEGSKASVSEKNLSKHYPIPKQKLKFTESQLNLSRNWMTSHSFSFKNLAATMNSCWMVDGKATRSSVVRWKSGKKSAEEIIRLEEVWRPCSF